MGFDGGFERSRKPASGCFKLAELAQHDELTSRGNVPPYRFGRCKSAGSLKVAGCRFSSEILEYREQLAIGDVSQKAGGASTVGKAVAFSDDAGHANSWLPPIDQHAEDFLDCRTRRALNHRDHLHLTFHHTLLSFAILSA